MIKFRDKLQIESFFRELSLLLKSKDSPDGDYSSLYAKYPKVRIGIRRAMVWIEKNEEKYGKVECLIRQRNGNLNE